ncbi:hypothetical protein [Devosia riboflavina]
MPTISDPAAQLHAMCAIMARFTPERGNSVGQVALAELLGVQPNSSEYFMGIGAIAARFHRLQVLSDSALEEPYSSLLSGTLKALQTAFTAHSQINHWQPIRDQAFAPANMQTLLMASGVVRQHARISVPTPEERASAVLMIDEALEALEKHHGSLTDSIYMALQNTKRMLVRFDIYGVDSLADELLKAFALKTAAEAGPMGSNKERGAWVKAWAALMMVASTLMAADAGITAIENHYTRAQSVLAFFAGEQKQLPPPDTFTANGKMTRPEEAEEAEG